MILNCLVSWHGNDLQHIIKGYSFMASAGFAQNLEIERRRRGNMKARGKCEAKRARRPWLQ
jgi:hypothetical protein